MSLGSGVFPKVLKNAVISPVIKKPSHDPNTLKNYRPISNIPYLSKIIEKHAISSINEFITQQELGEPFQSAYKPCHSTETALLKVKDDILDHMSRQEGVFLVLLDLSSAFDTVSYPIVLERLRGLGIKGTVLDWVDSYLTDRSWTVHINGSQSAPSKLEYGVPQGSIVGPSIFNIYTLPIGNIIRDYGLSYHMYADDIQIYASFTPKDPSSITSVLAQLSSCIASIKTWMTQNMLKLNDEKTEFIVITSPHQQRSLPPLSLVLGDKLVEPTESVRNLGVIFDTNMSMTKHVKALCTSLNFHLRHISQIRRFMDFDTAHLVVRALILSRLDYGNSLLLGTTKTDILRLQRIQNWAAKMICQVAKYERATPSLRRLHWLPIDKRITFKLLCCVYRCLHDSAPQYLSPCVTISIPTRPNLRSSADTTRLLEHNTTRIPKSVECRSFRLTVPKLWNSIPSATREMPTLNTFKKHLKTFLYS